MMDVDDDDDCGLQCPMFKTEGDKMVGEPFAEEAKYFSEVRLLQRDVKIVLEGASNQNLLGTVIHPVAVLVHRFSMKNCLQNILHL